MNQTSKISLKLFEGKDKFDYKVINENFQKVDDALNKIVCGTKQVNDGDRSEYPEGTLYIVIEGE